MEGEGEGGASRRTEITILFISGGSELLECFLERCIHEDARSEAVPGGELHGTAGTHLGYDGCSQMEHGREKPQSICFHCRWIVSVVSSIHCCTRAVSGG